MSGAQHGRMQNAGAGGTPFSSSGASTATDAHPRRVSNACQGCKRRKAKCSGQPAPCERCRKLNSFCHFDEKLDTRRKTAWTASEIQQRQQYILHAVLHALRSNDEKDLKELLKTVRESDSPQELAQCILRQIHSLQDRQIIAKADLDIHDVLSLAVEGLTQGQTARKPHGPGAWGTSRSLSTPEGVPDPDSGQQADSHTPTAYLGSNPTFEPEFDTGALTSDHAHPEDPEALPQFSFDVPSIYYQPTNFRQPMQSFGYGLSPLSPVGSDTTTTLGLGNTVASIEIPPAGYSAVGPSTSLTNRLNSPQHLNTLPATSILQTPMSGTGGALNAPTVDADDWATSQQLLDGFNRPWAQDITNRAGRLNLTMDPKSTTERRGEKH